MSDFGPETGDAKSNSTLRSYDRAKRKLLAFASEQGLVAFPAAPQTIALYCKFRRDQDASRATLDQEIEGICYWHQRLGYARPDSDWALSEFVAGLLKGMRPSTPWTAPLFGPELHTLVRSFASDPRGLRDAAAFLLLHAGAAKRAELADLEMAHVHLQGDSLFIDLPEKPRLLIIRPGVTDLCPIRALTRWVRSADIISGPLFRKIDRHGNIEPGTLSAKAINDHIIKKRTEGRYTSEAPRFGFEKAATLAGVSAELIGLHTSRAWHTRHIRERRTGALQAANLTEAIGL